MNEDDENLYGCVVRLWRFLKLLDAVKPSPGPFITFFSYVEIVSYIARVKPR